MKRHHLPLLMLGLLFMIFTIKPGFADAATKQETAKVTVDQLNVREKPSIKSKKVGTLKKGTMLTVFDKTKSGWSQIQYNNKKAYVSTNYLDFSKPAATVKRLSHEKRKEIKYAKISNVKNKAAEKKANSILRKHADKAYAYHLKLKKQEKIDKPGQTMPGCHYFNDSDFKTKFNQGNKLSIVFTNYEYQCGAHGMPVVTSYNFTLNNGKQIKLNDVLTTKTKKTKVQKYAYNYILKNPARFYPDLKQSNVKINSNTQFYYYDSGIVLIFQAYEIAPYAAGNPTIKIPASVYK